MQLNRFVVEVRGGVVLFFNCTTELDDGWWWGFNASPLQHGPFASSDEAVADASREMGRFKLVRWDDATIRRKNHEELRPTGHIVVIDTDGALFKTGERPARSWRKRVHLPAEQFKVLKAAEESERDIISRLVGERRGKHEQEH